MSGELTKAPSPRPPPMSSELEGLLERVEKATGPDRLLDEAIMMAFYVRDVRFIGATCEGCDCPDAPRHKDPVWVDPATDEWVSTNAYEFTSSLDRALALVERVLPGWSWELGTHNGRRTPEAIVIPPDLRPGQEVTAWGAGPTPALALLAAILKAKLSETSNV